MATVEPGLLTGSAKVTLFCRCTEAGVTVTSLFSLAALRELALLDALRELALLEALCELVLLDELRELVLLEELRELVLLETVFEVCDVIMVDVLREVPLLDTVDMLTTLGAGPLLAELFAVDTDVRLRGRTFETRSEDLAETIVGALEGVLSTLRTLGAIRSGGEGSGAAAAGMAGA